MPFQEISSPSLRKLFVQQLEGLILSGELRPGDRLPTERELADEMKISKTVVHEGLRELHQAGLFAGRIPQGGYGGGLRPNRQPGDPHGHHGLPRRPAG